MTGFVLKPKRQAEQTTLINGRRPRPTGARRNVFSNRRYLKLT